MQKNFGKSREEFEAILEHLPDAEREGFRRMGEMFKPWETLHPELALYLYEDHMGTHLKHPLVFDVMYCPGLRDGMLNEQYEAKSKAVAEYRAEGKWSSFVFMHERPYRLDALMKIQDEIEDDCEFWDLVSGVWTDTENARQNYEEWDDLFSSERSCRESMMNDAEREVLAGLPKEFVIHRGFRFKEDEYDGIEGFSWSLDYERAVWFAKRFAGPFGDVPQVATAKVHKHDVIAYLDGRGEDEIVVLPEDVIVIERKEVA